MIRRPDYQAGEDSPREVLRASLRLARGVWVPEGPERCFQGLQAFSEAGIFKTPMDNPLGVEE